jgi:hypothetical protein
LQHHTGGEYRRKHDLRVQEGRAEKEEKEEDDEEVERVPHGS